MGHPSPQTAAVARRPRPRNWPPFSRVVSYFDNVPTREWRRQGSNPGGIPAPNQPLSSPAGSRHSTDWSEPPVRDWEQTYDLIEALLEIGDQHGVSVARVALAYLLRKPGVTSLVVGARTAEQLDDNLQAVALELSGSEMDRLDAISAPPLLYPYSHQARMADDERYSPADLALLRQHLRYNGDAA